MRYLIIKTKTDDGKEFTHSIELTDTIISQQIFDLFKHIDFWHEKFVNSYFEEDRYL